LSRRSSPARQPRRATSSVAVALVAALATATPAGASFDATLRAATRAVSFSRTADGEQARYDAGRNLEEAVYSLRTPQRRCRLLAALTIAHGLIREAEGYDRPLAALERAGRRQAELGVQRLRPCPRADDLVRLPRRTPGWSAYPPLRKAAPARSTDAALAGDLARIGRSFGGWAAVWTHDLLTGHTAGWNSDARFPAASTVKLGLLLAALRRAGPFPSALDYDLRAMTAWSSNLAANRLFARAGGRSAVETALRRVGATRSTYPQGFRVGTSVHALDVDKEPPLVSGRVTTAHDLGRVLYAIHAGALGNVPTLRRSGLTRARSLYALSLLLRSRPVGNNVGLLRPWARGIPIAQKNGWLHDARHTAAIVYAPSGPKIVVVLTYAPNLPLARARELGRLVVRACLRRRSRRGG
jgi:beta-lactamase class A